VAASLHFIRCLSGFIFVAIVYLLNQDRQRGYVSEKVSCWNPYIRGKMQEVRNAFSLRSKLQSLLDSLTVSCVQCVQPDFMGNGDARVMQDKRTVLYRVRGGSDVQQGR
jgi:hypothetical protein